MEFPENISSLTVEEIRNYVAQIDARLGELVEERKDGSKTVADLVANKDEVELLEAKKADFGVALSAVGQTDGGATEDETVEEVVESVEETQEDVTETEDEVTSVEGATEQKEVETESTETIEAETTEETSAEAETTESETVEETKEEITAEVEETTAQNTGEEIVADDINQATESTEETAYIAASFLPVADGVKTDVEAVEKVRVKTHGGDAFRVRYDNGNVINNDSMNAKQWTDHIMALGTPGREGELSFAQKQYSKSLLGKVDAAFCQPPELIDADIQCGSYTRTLGSAFPSFLMDGLEVQWFQPVDASDPDFVGEVDLDASEINKACFEAPCPELTTARAREIKACLQANEQTAFTSSASIQALLRDGEALLPALADQILLEQIITETNKFEYTAVAGSGYGAIKAYTGVTLETLERQSLIHNNDGLVPIVPRSLAAYVAGDNAVRQFSLSNAQEVADEIFDGLGLGAPIVIDDALDITDDRQVPVLSKTVAITPAFRDDWTIHLIDPADGFIGRRSENDYSIEPVAQSIAEKRANRLSWFARQYELFGRRGCSSWASIEIKGLCLGGRVIAAAACL